MFSFWENYYQTIPLSQIPWQNTQATWLEELLSQGIIKGDTALDVGCGTGKKSLILAAYGFSKVVGVDISQKATEYAKKNAQAASCQNQTTFITHSSLNLSFLGDQTFDFILDWAHFHCLPATSRHLYVQQLTKHSHRKTTLLLRCFSRSSKKVKEHFTTTVNNQTQPVYRLTISEINNYFGKDFKIVRANKSKPKTHKDINFAEYLMLRRENV